MLRLHKGGWQERSEVCVLLDDKVVQAVGDLGQSIHHKGRSGLVAAWPYMSWRE